jgi:hypothetical protein
MVVEQQFSEALEPPRPKTLTVVAMLIAAALILSYLMAYAVTNALVAAEVVSRWPPGSDPRPLRMCFGFIALMTAFTLAASIAQWMSRRQLKRIDEMEQA